MRDFRCQARTPDALKRCQNRTKLLFCKKHKGRYLKWLGIILGFPGLITIITTFWPTNEEAKAILSTATTTVVQDTSRLGLTKILILPFENPQYTKQQFGALLRSRLEEIEETDSIDIDPTFLFNYEYPQRFDIKTRDSDSPNLDFNKTLYSQLVNEFKSSVNTFHSTEPEMID